MIEHRIECKVGEERRWASSRGSALTSDWEDARVFAEQADAHTEAAKLAKRRGVDAVRVVTTSTSRLDAHDILAIAVESMVDPRTVRRYLRGDSVRDLQRRHIERALSAMGHERLVRR